MAMSRRAPLRAFCPRWPERSSIDPDRVAFGYDYPSDTLFVDLDGTAHPAVSVPIEPGLGAVDVYLRVDPRSEEVVGFQIEGVLAAAHRPAWLCDALALADLQENEPDTANINKGKAVEALFRALAPAMV